VNDAAQTLVGAAGACSRLLWPCYGPVIHLFFDPLRPVTRGL